MKLIKGAHIRELPLTGLGKVADLIYFEGPLLSIFKNDRGDSYFYCWCEADQDVNRWLVFRVSDKDLNSYLSKKLSLRDLVLKPSDGFLFSVDIDNQLQSKNIHIINPLDLPQSYIPSAESFYDFSPITAPQETSEVKGSIYRILVDGDWTFLEFSVIPEVYTQIYAFFYALSQMGEETDISLKDIFTSYPWRGGYSTVNFYNRLRSYISSENEPQVISIQYASPGWIELDLIAPVAFSIKNSVLAYVAAFEDLETLYHEIHNDLSKRKLLRDAKSQPQETSVAHKKRQGKKGRKLPAPLSKDDLDFIVNAIDKLAQGIKLESLNQIDELTSDHLITLKILLSLYRRIRILASSQRMGKTQY